MSWEYGNRTGLPRGPAEEYGLDELASEDFQHDRLYGTVRAVNPFL